MSNFRSGTILGLLPGDIIDGRFQIGKVIGYGGQGVVLSVNHLEWERELALKLPLPEAINSPKKRDRFVREAESWIRLGVHPNIVRCWFVRRVSGLPGLFLDLISGGSLEEQIKSDRIGPGRWIEIIDTLVQVSEGLAHAHAMGMVHRDIKPENLLLRGDGRVCVTDFGLVKSTDREALSSQSAELWAGKDSGTTGVGEFLGTPRYGAPEQWNKAMTIVPATDVYAMGVILYELICGRRPFDSPGENPDPLALIHRHLKLAPPDPRDHHSGIPDELARLSLQCLSKDPALRPRDGIELLLLLNATRERLFGKTYPRVKPLPERDRPALLNNAAVSLYSLGKLDKCRENLEKGLLLQADHPECLYNLLQLDRRAGRMGSVDSLQRLRRANAVYPLALLCLEDGHAKLAREIFNALPEGKKNGLVLRTEGDALMYLGEFGSAAEYYSKARLALPNDRATLIRQELAQSRVRELDGNIYFPSNTSCFKSQHANSQNRFLLSQSGLSVLSISPQDVEAIEIRGGRTRRRPRPAGACQPEASWQSGSELLIQDGAGFELWNCETLEPLARSAGTVLATTRALTHIVYCCENQLFLLDKLQRSSHRIELPAGTSTQGVKACFNTDQTSLYVLSSEGMLGQVDPHCRVVPAPLPSKLEAQAEIVTFQVHQKGLLAMVTSDSVVRVVNLQSNLPAYQQQLPFLPTELEFDASGEALVFRSSQCFGVFNSNGTVTHRGNGACAVDPQGEHLLSLSRGLLTLYALNPFRRIRAWSEKIDIPYQLRFSPDGRRALTLSKTGAYQVWEVDEKNRVFERELLLTAGETYEELLSSFDAFHAALSQAIELLRKGRHFESYLTVCKARETKGFLQSEEALTAHWMLGQTLQRTGLDALWERIFHRGIRAAAASSDGGSIALVRGTRCSVMDFTGSSTMPRFNFDFQSLPLACHFHSVDPEDVKLFIVETKGILHCFRMSDGEKVRSTGLELGFLLQASFHEGRLLAISKDGMARSYDLKKDELSEPCAIPTGERLVLFPLPNKRAVLAGPETSRVLDFSRNVWTDSFPIDRPEHHGALTYMGSARDESLLLAGFSDGTLMVAEASSRKVLFSTHQDVGGITGICIEPGLALGVSVSTKGRLTLFDLNNGHVFRSFTAHSDAIKDVQIFADSRYIITRTERGEFRLWETLWKLCEQKRPMPLAWMPTKTLGKLGRLFGLG